MSGDSEQVHGVDTTGVPRRNFLRYTLIGAGCLGTASLLKTYFSAALKEEGPADIFKGDAPSEQVWEAWKKRGWTREAMHYLKLGKNVQCKICPNNCLLEPGDRSHCRNKINRDGVLYTMAYGNPCSINVDPVEKKPLFHFLPGSRTFSLATSGCVFRCLNCQNWEISQKKPEETKTATGPEFRLKFPDPGPITLTQLQNLSLFPEDITEASVSMKCPSVSYTYSEPTSYYEYMLDSCKANRSRHIKNILVSCGSIEERPLRELAPLIDAAHIDLKGFDESTYQKLNSGKLQPILNTLKVLKEMGVWVEVINLVVPQYTDNLDSIRRMCDWLLNNLGQDQVIHFSRFFPQHKLTQLPPTPLDQLVQAQKIAKGQGLRFAYIGNARELPDAETTYCPSCKKAIIEREVFRVTQIKLSKGQCAYCQTTIPGIWTTS